MYSLKAEHVTFRNIISYGDVESEKTLKSNNVGDVTSQCQSIK